MSPRIDFSRLDSLAGIAPEFTYEDMPGTSQTEDDFVFVPVKAIRQANEFKEKMLSSLKTGDPDYLILLQAAEVIALFTKDEQFLMTVKETILAVHGEGLEREIPLEWLLENLEDNRARLEQTLKRKNLKPETRKRIEEALADTSNRIDTIQETLFNDLL